MDLFSPTRAASIGGKRYAFVIVDDFSRFTWVIFLSHRNEAFANFEAFCRKVQREAGYFITTIHSDHGGEFENKAFEEFCAQTGFTQNFSSPRSPQQNGVVERKNCSLQDTARTMLLDRNLQDHFWAEAVSTACHILNRCLIRPILKKTPYELWRGKKPNISYFHPFSCKCFIHNNGKNNLGKFDPRSDEGIFLGYAPSSRDFLVFNKRTLSVEESVHVVFDDTNPRLQEIEVGDDETASFNQFEAISKVITETNTEELATAEMESTTPVDKTHIPREWRHNASYPKNFIMGKPDDKIQTRSSLRKQASLALVSQMEPKRINEAMEDESWIQTMKEELDQFEKNQNFANLMKGEFEMSLMGELSFFLGLQIKQCDKGIFISQDTDITGKEVDEKQYRGMIGSLLYLTASRPDIMFSVCKCARFQSAPRESHLTVVKRIIRYLIGTSNMGRQKGQKKYQWNMSILGKIPYILWVAAVFNFYG
ncbi:hypothetical protein KY284_030183 [Solanum tuberosum]|nr:hypothetical protein KY284_030183 [Solanum tuberosum]